MKPEFFYLAVRACEGREWFDTLSLSTIEEISRDKTRENALIIPQWDKANPVVRIAKVTIVEVIA